MPTRAEVFEQAAPVLRRFMETVETRLASETGGAGSAQADGHPLGEPGHPAPSTAKDAA